MEQKPGQSPSPSEVCDLDTHILGELAGEIQSDQPFDRLHAVSVLGRFGMGPGALEALKLITTEDPDNDVRRQARIAYDKLKLRVANVVVSEMRIRKAGGGIDLPRFVEYLNMANPIYRIEAILQVIDANDKSGLQPVLDRLNREKDEWVVATLVRAVGCLGEPGHLSLILPFLEWDAHPRVISNAVEALAKLDVRAAGRDIARMVDHRDPRVQSMAVMALFSIEREAALVCLQAMARSARTNARSAAAHCLARLKDADCIAMLHQMVADEPDPGLKKRLDQYLDALEPQE